MKKKRMSDKKALNFISVGISVFAVLVSIWAGVSASNASTEANSIASVNWMPSAIVFGKYACSNYGRM